MLIKLVFLSNWGALNPLPLIVENFVENADIHQALLIYDNYSSPVKSI